MGFLYREIWLSLIYTTFYTWSESHGSGQQLGMVPTHRSRNVSIRKKVHLL